MAVSTQSSLSSIITEERPSLAQFLQEERQHYADIPEALLRIVYAIASASKMVNALVRRLDLTGLVGSLGVRNTTGDMQQQLDVIAHHHFLYRLSALREVCAVASEEATDIVTLGHPRGDYIIALDPLDGSPNIDVNAAIGTIFSVYRRHPSRASTPVQQDDILQPGTQQQAAGYILYGTSTILVYTTSHGVHSFTYDPIKEEFLLARQDIQMPKEGKIYAINDGYWEDFPGYVRDYIQQCRRHGCVARYGGALVADFHRHLVRGGIYLYPPTQKNPTGKLRLMLECNALALLAEHAGGKASSGQHATLHILPTTLHQQVPLYVGSAHMIQALLAARARAGIAS